MAHDSTLDPIGLFAARVTSKDESILGESPVGEQREAVHDLVALFLLFCLEFGLWSFAMTSFGAPLYLAIPVAFLVALIIMQMDIRMTSSDNEARGALRTGGFKKDFYTYTAVRFTMCMILAVPAAVAMDLAIFREEALAVMAADRNAHDRPTLLEYDRKIGALREQTLGAAENELDGLNAQRSQIIATQKQVRDQAAAHDAEHGDAALEAGRQVLGFDGRLTGDGKRAKEARIRAELARQQAEKARGEARILLDDAKSVEIQLSDAQARYDQRLRLVQPQIDRLTAERNQQFARDTSGPLTVFQGLIKLHDDPVRGVGVGLISIAVWLLTMALELSFFLRLVFKPASVYDHRLTLHRQTEAVLATYAARERIAPLRRRPPLRVVEA